MSTTSLGSNVIFANQWLTGVIDKFFIGALELIGGCDPYSFNFLMDCVYDFDFEQQAKDGSILEGYFFDDVPMDEMKLKRIGFGDENYFHQYGEWGLTLGFGQVEDWCESV